MRGVADLAARYGYGEMRLTVRQNLVIRRARSEDRGADGGAAA